MKESDIVPGRVLTELIRDYSWSDHVTKVVVIPYLIISVVDDSMHKRHGKQLGVTITLLSADGRGFLKTITCRRKNIDKTFMNWKKLV